MTGVNRVFYKTVYALEAAANWLDPYWPGGMDYNKINVYLMYLAFASAGANVIMLAAILAML